MSKKKTFCNICSAFCGFEAAVENNRIVAFSADKNHPMSKGFSCSKGRHFHTLLTSPDRVTHCHERINGGMQKIDRSLALKKISQRLEQIIDTHGPESVAVYCGNGVTFKALVMSSVHAFMKGLGSHHIYTSLTIDQPAKIIAAGRHGVWAAGGHSFESARVLMLFGSNPLVSGLNGPGSIPGWQPGALKAAKKKGLKLIVVDPRRTETARQADLYLPIRPGTDAVMLSGMINHILQSDLHDAGFCAEFTAELEGLREQVRQYDLARTAKITGVEATLIKEAVELFVAQRRGCASSGTGPDMAPHANLTEHLIYSINTLCGRHNRAGDKVPTSLLTPNFPPIEAVVPFDYLPNAINLAKNTRRSRVRGARQIFGEMPTATLPEEILTPGKGQLRALLVIGGNPLLSFPEQELTRRALQSLDLCVVIDGRFSETAEHADFFLPSTLGLEKFDMTIFNDMIWGKPFHQISEAVVAAPDDAMDEYLYLIELAHRLGLRMSFSGVEIDTAKPPRDLDLLALIYPEGSVKVPVRDIAARPGGYIYNEFDNIDVIPAPEGMKDKLRFMPEGIESEFAALAESIMHGSTCAADYRLICRRNPHVYNSMCHGFPLAPQENPAWFHPDDLTKLGVRTGDCITLSTSSASINATAREDDSMQPGVIAMSHGFSESTGAVVSRLLTMANTTDGFTKMPQMSAIPVSVRRLI